MINCDANASYGLLPEVREAVSAWSVDFANPSAIHQLGQRARAILEEARNELSGLMQLDSRQRIVFTSGATEALNQALFYPFWNLSRNQTKDVNYLTTTTEHPATLTTFHKLASLGITTNIFDNQKQEIFSMKSFLKEVTPETICCSLMFANNETGYIYPVKEIFTQIKKDFSSVYTVCDAVQALGKLPINYSELNADFIAISGHKIGALTGIGALVVNDHLPARALISGGPQELSWRAGTENLLGAYSLGIAAKVMKSQLSNNLKSYKKIKQKLIAEIQAQLPNAKINFEQIETLPNTISLEIPRIKADDLVVAMDLAGIAISSGSACASGKPSPSHVLLAIGKSEEQARSTIRISFRADLSAEEQSQLVNHLVKNVPVS